MTQYINVILIHIIIKVHFKITILKAVFCDPKSRLENKFRCPHSGSTFSLHESIDFDTLSTNSHVVTRTDPQFFCILRSNINIFY